MRPRLAAWRPRRRPTTSSRRAAPGSKATILTANKIALGQIESAIAGGVDTTSDAPLAINEDLRQVLLDANRSKSNAGARQGPGPHPAPAAHPRDPPATPSRAPGLSMGEHTAIMAKEWGIGREEQDELAANSHRNLAAAYDSGFLEDLVTPFLGQERDQNLRPDSSAGEAGQASPRVRGSGRHHDRRQLDAAVRRRLGRPAGQRGMGRGSVVLPVQAYFVTAQTAAVDHVHKREGLLMAPAYAVARLLERTGRRACRTSTSTRSTKPSRRRS